MQSASVRIALWRFFILPTYYKVRHDEKGYLAVPSGTDKAIFPLLILLDCKIHYNNNYYYYYCYYYY